MNIIQKIKALFALKSSVEEIVKEGKMETALGKPGWKTTEFWMNAAAQVATLWGAVQGFVPPKVAVIVSISGAAVYTIARTVLKAVSDIQTARAAIAETK
jgi:hypothetical protein